MFSPSHIPNIVSCLRIASAPFLFAFAYFGHSDMFAWLLIVAFISDTVDGIIARAFGFTSELGVLLDSVCDFLVYSATAYGIVCFYPQIISTDGFAFAFVIVLWWGSGLAGLWRYGRLASFHTSLSRITAYGAGGFLGGLIIWGFNAWLIWTAVVLVAVSVVEVLILVILLPTWMPNVRGLYWLVVNRVIRREQVMVDAEPRNELDGIFYFSVPAPVK